ncbi:MAG TPA: hypothetical protein ACFYD6_12995 [Candidatus Brocadiia bacterium]|nr:hypothetical protein [Candidatus Brocadiales bacterium]
MFNISDFTHEPLKVRPFGDVVGKYPIPFLKHLFDYATRYDVEKGTKENGFIFDRRLGAINVWDWKRGVIYTTLYANWSTGAVTLQKGTLKESESWTPGQASIFWTKVFANVKSNKPTVLFANKE